MCHISYKYNINIIYSQYSKLETRPGLRHLRIEPSLSGYPNTSFTGLLHLGHNLYGKHHNPSSSNYPDNFFRMSLMDKLPRCEEGHNSIKYSYNFTKR